jgi:hypothetical protein
MNQEPSPSRGRIQLFFWLALTSAVINLIAGGIFVPQKFRVIHHEKVLAFKAKRYVETIHNITSLSAARLYKVAPIQLGSVSSTRYTIRINTWNRNQQLLLSINHHSKCEGVHSIHVIWCSESNPPDEILHHHSHKVVIERHEVNSLNERWRIMSLENSTLGILSLDDDVLRPCEALDAAFIRWFRHPDRYV